MAALVLGGGHESGQIGQLGAGGCGGARQPPVGLALGDRIGKQLRELLCQVDGAAAKVQRLRGANSSRYTAAATPTGRAVSSTTSIM